MTGASRARLRTVVQAAFAVAVIVFVAIYLAKVDWEQLRGLRFAWAPMIVATLLGLLYRYWGAYIWLVLLSRLGATGMRRHWTELSAVYAKAWLGRYILGAGTWILGKVYFASQHGISKSKLAVSGVLEGALQLIATLAVGLALVAVDPRFGSLSSEAVVLTVVALVVCVVALVPPVFRFLMDLAYRVVRRRRLPASDRPDGRTIVTGGLLYVAGTFITGVSYYFVARAVYADLGWADVAYVVGSASIASAISLLAVFAPGGIGVREGVQVLLLSALMPTEAAVLITVVTRLWSVLVDVLFFGAAWSWARVARRRTGAREQVLQP